MSEISPISQTAPAALPPGVRAQRAQASAPTPARPSDKVQFSTAARLLAKLQELPDVRQNLVDQVKSQIAAGTYETPQKLDAAIQAMIQDVAQ